MNIVENSAEDLLLRGFNQSEILDRTGIDVGYHGRSFCKKLSGIDRVDYKVDFVKNHYTKQQLLDVLDEYANGLDKEEVLHHVGISGINIIRLKVLFDRLGLQEEFKAADSKYRRFVMAGGMLNKYGVDNPFKLQQFQNAGQNTRESKYGAKFTLAKGSVFAKEARKKIRQTKKNNVYREIHERSRELLSGKFHKWTTETFIEAANYIHNNKYDYSKTVYVKNDENIIVICPKHGEFLQKPNNHLRGTGCSQCAGVAAWTTDAFIKEAKKRFGDAYDYSQVGNINNAHCHATIICPKHGAFKQAVTHHLSGEGCPKCADDRRMLTCMKRYGVPHIGGTPECVEKARRTSLERYGATHYCKTNAYKERLPEIMKHVHEVSQERYGANYWTQSEDYKQYIKSDEYRKKKLPQMLSKLHESIRGQYGAENWKQSEDHKKRWPEILEKIKNTSKERYGADYWQQSESHKLQLPAIHKKVCNTLKVNGTYRTSSTEKLFFDISDFEQQHYDNRYPYLCDFYDKNTDAFIEINASWVHGFHWFGSDKKDNDRLNYFKKRGENSDYYASTIYTWTQSDVEKRECARKNNLNYITFWDAKGSDADLWMNMGCPKGHDYDYEYSWLPDRKIATDVDISKMHLSIGKLSTVVKDAQRNVFYEHELALWNNNAYRCDKWGTVRAFLYANRWKYIHKLPDELTDRMLLRAFRISGLYVGYTSFDNAMMLQVIEKYGVTSVYDPCSGWGERMATCGLLGVDYEGCDINDRLVNGYNKLIGLIDGFKPLMHINDSAKQDVEHNVDAIITCPPYMDVEIYTDKGAEHYDKNKFTSWWKDVVAKCSATNAKVFAVQTNQACRDIFLSGMTNAGWKLSEELTYSNARVSHFHRTGKSVKHEFESMLIMTR